MSFATSTPLTWRPSPLAQALATCAGTALLAGLLSGQWALAVFAAPLLGALGARGWLGAPPAEVGVSGALSSAQCFEAEVVEVRLRAGPQASDAAVTLHLVAESDLQVLEEETGVYRVAAAHWGSYPVEVRLTATAAGGLLVAAATVCVAYLRVYPEAPAERVVLPDPQLVNRFGAHLSRRRGIGVEFADIRPYVPGDPMRSINWPASARRGQLQITERFTDRAADVVVIIDTYPQPPGPAAAALELSVRGATQVVQSALQDGDRAGVVALGTRVRWLGPDTGQRQFYRVLDAVLDFGEDTGSTTGTLAPRQSIPPGATVIAFSTLLSTDFTLAMIDLRRRGHVVLVVDVLRGAPFTEELDAIAERLWRLERTNVHRDLGVSGIDVMAWPEDSRLAAILGQLDRRMVRR